MAVYVLVLVVTVLLTYLSQLIESRSKWVAVLPLILVIFILSGLGGARDFSVGFDFMYYCNGHFKYACMTDSFAKVYNYIGEGKPIWFYSLIHYCVAGLTNDPHVVMFMLTFATFTLAMIACWKMRDKCPIAISFTMVYALMYVDSFNIIKQSLAATAFFCLYAYKDKPILSVPFLGFAAISIGAHYTALIGIAIILLLKYLDNVKERWSNFVLMTYLIALPIMALSFVVILQALAARLPDFEHYLMYTEESAAGWSKPTLPKVRVLFCALIVIYVFFALTIGKQKVKDMRDLMVLTDTTFIFYTLGLYTSSLGRLSMYTFFLTIISLLYSFKRLDVFTKRTVYLFQTLVVVVFVIGLFFIKEVIFNPNDFLSYRSELLNFDD